MASVEDFWPNEAGFDTNYEQNEPIALTVRGTIPYYAAGVLCTYSSDDLRAGNKLTSFCRPYWSSWLQDKN
jgi:hypothetical protein